MKENNSIMKEKAQLQQSKNELYFAKLRSQINKPVTVGYIDTTLICDEIREFTNILLGLSKRYKRYMDGKYIGLIIDGPRGYKMSKFINEDYTVIYIKDEEGNIIYQNDIAQEMCPRAFDHLSIAVLIEASFGEEVARDYIEEKNAYWLGADDYIPKYEPETPSLTLKPE